jgi:hypothetical protein
LGEETGSETKDKFLTSEDYKIRQLSVGDNMVTDLNSEDEAMPLVIADIKSGIYGAKDKDETSMVLDWKTNKTSSCDISYYKKGDTASKISKEGDFVLSHTMVISNLDADSVYGYKIKCLDRWGNEKTSEEYVFYTGAPNVSFMDILGNAAGKLFGWAIKK